MILVKDSRTILFIMVFVYAFIMLSGCGKSNVGSETTPILEQPLKVDAVSPVAVGTVVPILASPVPDKIVQPVETPTSVIIDVKKAPSPVPKVAPGINPVSPEDVLTSLDLAISNGYSRETQLEINMTLWFGEESKEFPLVMTGEVASNGIDFRGSIEVPTGSGTEFIDIIVFDHRTFEFYPNLARWVELPEGVEPVTPVSLTSLVRANFADVVYVGPELLKGTPSHHLRGVIPASSLSISIPPLENSEGDLDTHFWVDVETWNLLSLSIQGHVKAGPERQPLDPSLEVGKFVEQFEQNALLASERFKGKVVIIKGIIDAIDFDSSGNPYVGLSAKAKSSGYSLRCVLNIGSPVTGLIVGEVAIVKGVFNTWDKEDLVLNDCEVGSDIDELFVSVDATVWASNFNKEVIVNLPDLPPDPIMMNWDSSPKMNLEGGQDYVATIKIFGGGEIVIDLFEDKVPMTVNNFVFLAEEGYYDGVMFHRVIPGFMAQTGDQTGTGSGGPGYSFDNEFHFDARHDGPGIVSMANRGVIDGSGTNGSQFFITYVDTPSLDGLEFDGTSKECSKQGISCHAVFGRVIEGMNVVEGILPRDPMVGGPGDVIESVEISFK